MSHPRRRYYTVTTTPAQLFKFSTFLNNRLLFNGEYSPKITERGADDSILLRLFASTCWNAYHEIYAGGLISLWVFKCPAFCLCGRLLKADNFGNFGKMKKKEISFAPIISNFARSIWSSMKTKLRNITFKPFSFKLWRTPSYRLVKNCVFQLISVVGILEFAVI